MWQHTQSQPHNSLLRGLRHSLSHIIVTLLAVGIAFSLPTVAQYVLYDWWPGMQNDVHLLLVTELGLSVVLVLLFNVLKITWDNRFIIASARHASLVYATGTSAGPSCKKAKQLVKQSSSPRDVFVLTLTGYDTFAGPHSLFHEVLHTAYEIRVMLLDPHSDAASKRVEAIPNQDVNLESLHDEIGASIAYLTELHKAGKRISLKFYRQQPLWKVVVVGDHVWVQHFHHGYELKQQPEYVFALQPNAPRQGLFVPFYTYFLDYWSQRHHPVYDFDTGELVYRAVGDKELRRAPYPAGELAGLREPLVADSSRAAPITTLRQ